MENLQGQTVMEVAEVVEEPVKEVKPKAKKEKKAEVNWKREHDKVRREVRALEKEIVSLKEEVESAKKKHEILFHSEQKAKKDLMAQADRFQRAQSLLADGIINVLSMNDLATRK